TSRKRRPRGNRKTTWRQFYDRTTTEGNKIGSGLTLVHWRATNDKLLSSHSCLLRARPSGRNPGVVSSRCAPVTAIPTLSKGLSSGWPAASVGRWDRSAHAPVLGSSATMTGNLSLMLGLRCRTTGDSTVFRRRGRSVDPVLLQIIQTNSSLSGYYA